MPPEDRKERNPLTWNHSFSIETSLFLNTIGSWGANVLQMPLKREPHRENSLNAQKKFAVLHAD